MVVYGTTGDGKKIPLDPKARVYRVVGKDYNTNESEERILVERSVSAMVSHASTCPRPKPKPWKHEVDRTVSSNDQD